MEANLCLPTRHFPAMSHHKNVRVHSNVRLPALQAKVGPLPGAARLAVVGAGVVLSCALGAMYLKGAQAQPLLMSPRTQITDTSQYENGDGASGIVSIKDLRELLSEIFIGQDKLTTLMKQCLNEKDVKNFSTNQDLTSLLEKKFLKRPSGDHDLNLGLVLVLALLREKKYYKANKICHLLNSEPIAILSDARPHLLAAITNMMVAMESMLQFPNNTSTDDLNDNLKQVEVAWEGYKRRYDFQAAPPDVTDK